MPTVKEEPVCEPAFHVVVERTCRFGREAHDLK